MRRLRLGIDVDGVLADWDFKARELLRREFGMLLNESRHWDDIERQIGPLKWTWLWEEGIKKGLFLSPPQYPENVRELKDAAKRHDIVLITKVPWEAREDRLHWLKEKEIPFKQLEMLDKGSNKGDIKCDAYLDDYEVNVEEIAKKQIQAHVCLLDRPWNRKVSLTTFNTFRVHSLAEFIRFIESIEKGEEKLRDSDFRDDDTIPSWEMAY